jgi:haloalkane dehalogenase
MKTLEQVAAGLSQFRSHSIKIIWGGADFCFNDWFFHRWQAIFPEAQTHYLPDAGHYVLEDADREVLAEIAGFLT